MEQYNKILDLLGRVDERVETLCEQYQALTHAVQTIVDKVHQHDIRLTVLEERSGHQNTAWATAGNIGVKVALIILGALLAWKWH